MKRSMGFAVLGLRLAGALGAALFLLPQAVNACRDSSGFHMDEPDYSGFHAFMDKDDGTYFAFTLDSTSGHTGSIALGVEGVGLVGSSHDIGFDGHGHESMKITFDGTGALDAAAKLDLDFGLNQPSNQTQSVRFRLVGDVDLVHNTSSIQAWINGKHYSVIGRRPSKAPDSAISELTGALRRSDWGAIYDMSAPIFRQQIDRGSFVSQATALWRSKVGAGTFAIHLAGAPVLGDGRSGVWTASTTFSVSGTTASARYNVTLVWQSGTWLLLDVESKS